MPANATDTPTYIPGKSGPGPVQQTSFSIRGRGASLPGYSEVGLQERAMDRYEVVKPLGEGGMGEVSLVQDHDIDRRVAVKFLHSDIADPGMVARFIEEIHTVGQLEHPNIVPIHDAGRDDDGRYFFVMKHIEGETLGTIIAKLREGDPAYLARYTFLERVEIFIGILNARASCTAT
jgi:serine/threonine-protein kinase